MRIVIAALIVLATVETGWAESFGLPVDCELGASCFVQQTPDLLAGPDVQDAFCGRATYDGHTGWDIRVPTIRDAESGVIVRAVSFGTVLRVRDGLPDRLVRTAADKAKVVSTECGNGLVIGHDGGLETQYCHLRRGSVLVKSGDLVRKDQPIGQVGYSGLAAFPHVHLTVRRDSVVVDPLTARPLDAPEQDCRGNRKSLFDPAVTAQLEQPLTAIIGAGLSGTPPQLEALVDGETFPISSGNTSLIGWAWAINLTEGSRIAIQVIDPSGTMLVNSVSEPMPRQKATYLSYAGRQIRPEPGLYSLQVEVLGPDGERVRDVREVVLE